MKSLSVYIKEGFKIGRNIKIDKVDIESLKKVNIPSDLYYELSFRTPGEQWRHEDKMKEYQKKGSKPERLVKSIKDKSKLIKRWSFTYLLDWDDAYTVFRDEIVDRGYFTKEELDAYLVKRYYDKADDEHKEKIENLVNS